jgi:hypothetical protein
VTPYSPYRWLAFVIPGGVILFAFFYGWNGWPFPEPGATALVGILAAAFAVGAANAGAANWVEPVLWLHRPGSGQDPSWGLFGTGCPYEERERAVIEAELRSRYGAEASFRTGYNLAYTELQHGGKADRLNQLNEEIGFYRNMTTACIASAVVIGVYTIVWDRRALPPVLWIPLFVAMAILFGYRYRRFWRRFGDYVIRGFRTLPGR